MIRRAFLLTLALLPLGGSLAQASRAGEFVDSSLDSLTDWHIAGQNTTRYDLYDENGYKPSSVYPYDASQIYNESRLSFDRQFSPYETLNFSSAALLNGSDYRSTEEGWVFEDIRASWQKGDTAVPFRMDAGDFTANLSYRTIQQNIKGTQIEFQPNLKIGGLDQRHSFIGFAGSQQADYRDFQLDRNTFSGASWLVDLARYGVWAVHFVDNYREKDTKNGYMKDRHQGTLGLTFEKMFNIANQRIGIESEVNRFAGDYDSFTDSSGVERGKSDMGYFFKLSGVSGDLFDYGFRFEDYGDHFRPHGGVISSNRRAVAFKLGGNVYRELRLDTRYESYRDNVDSFNHFDTGSGGISLAGPIQNSYLRDLNIYFDVFRENVDSADRTYNVRTWSYVGHINSAIYKQWNGHLGGNIRNADDDAYQYVSITREYTADIGHPFSYKDIIGDARGGTVYRRNSGPSEGFQAGPFTSVSASKNNHSLNFTGQYLLDDSRSEFGQDVSSFNFSGGYSYTFGPHRFAFDFDMYNRKPQESFGATEDYRLGFSYTFSFDKPVGTHVRDFSWKQGYRAPDSVVERIWADTAPREMLFLEGTAPGKTLLEAQAFLESQGLKSPTAQGQLFIYEVRVFHDVDWRQRLVLEHDGERVVRTAILMDLDPGRNALRSEEAYERVRGFLLKRYANPSTEIHEGDFGSDYAGEINSGRLVRLTEWTTQAGKLRFGIPYSFGKPVRMEVQYAPEMPEPRSNRWGFETV